MFNYVRSGRKADELRNVSIEPNYMPQAEGSCLIIAGNTQVICAASLDQNVPPFLRKTGTGWVTAEYGMLPRSTGSRMQRESAKGRQDGRTQEIQRLIGRSLRSVVNLGAFGERQIIVDCDVIKADGGTRTAAITGGYVALYLAFQKMVKDGIIRKNPITEQVAAVSCGIVWDQAMLDLDYKEDSNAMVDANFVMAASGNLIEVQATAEKKPFSDKDFSQMLAFARIGCSELFKLQKEAIASYNCS